MKVNPVESNDTVLSPDGKTLATIGSKIEAGSGPLKGDQSPGHS